MFRNLAANLITHERIVTTDAKAKELRRVTERLITKAKHLGEAAYTPQDKLSADDKAKRLHVQRQLATFLPRWGVEKSGEKRDIVEKVIVELSQRFKERAGGYTRIIKVGDRRGDGASMSMIEFVDTTPVADELAAAAAEEAAAEEAAAEEAEEADESEESEGDDE
jgi:large subunit ribosomal protein L17